MPWPVTLCNKTDAFFRSSSLPLSLFLSAFPPAVLLLETFYAALCLMLHAVFLALQKEVGGSEGNEAEKEEREEVEKEESAASE